MKSKTTKKLDELLTNYNSMYEVNETKVIVPDIMPVIKSLMESKHSTGKKKMVEACRKLIRVAESNEACARAFMRTLLDKALPQIGKMIEEKIEKGKFKDTVIQEKE